MRIATVRVLLAMLMLAPCSAILARQQGGQSLKPPFDEVGPHLHENLAQLTTVVAVVLDWDELREAFLLGLRELGVAVRTFIVHPGPTGRRWDHLAAELGEITLVTPDEVERRLVVGESA